MTTATPLAPTTRLTLVMIEQAVEFFTSRLTAGPGELFEMRLRTLLSERRPRQLIVGDHRPQGVLLDALKGVNLDPAKPGILGPAGAYEVDSGLWQPFDPEAAQVGDELARFVTRGVAAQKAVDEAIKKALAGTSIIPDPAQLARALQLAEQVKQLERECDDRQAELNQRRERLLVLRREAAAAFTDPLQQPASTDGTGTTPPPLVSEATPAPVQAAPTEPPEPPPASAESPAPEPGDLYELKELAGLSDELLEHGLAKPPRHLFPQDESRAPTVPGEGGQIGRVIGYGGQYWAVVMCRMQRESKTFTLNPVLSLTDWQGAIGDPGTMPDTWERRRQDNDDVAPEDVPLEDMLVTDENGMKWVFGPDHLQWQVLVPIDKQAPAKRIDWVEQMQSCTTAEQAREVFAQHEDAINKFQRGLGLTTTCGRGAHGFAAVGFSCVKKNEWKSAIAAARKISLEAADELSRLVQEGQIIHGDMWEKLHDKEMHRFHKPTPAKKKKPAKPADRPSLLEAAARSQLKSPEQPAGQSMKWGPWKGSLLSALHKFNVDVGDVLPTGEALQMYLAGMKPSAAAQSYVHSLGKAGKALDKIEHTTSSITGKNGSAKKGGSSGRRR